MEKITDADLFFNLIGGAMMGRSLNVSSHFSPKLRDCLKAYWKTKEGRSVDAVLAHRLRMAPAALEDNPGKPVVLDLTDCLASYSEQIRNRSGAPLARRLAAWWDQWILKREETQWGQEAAKTTVISEVDAQALRENGLSGEKIAVLPNGIEVEGGGRSPRPEGFPPGRPVVCFVGNMGYAANEDGALWFLEKVWPKVKGEVPQALFAAVGGDPRPNLRKFHDGRDILVTGWVDRVEPYLRHADVSVAPLRVAVGMQNKVLLSLALGIPTVATPEALAWMPSEGRVTVLAVSGEEAFAQAIVDVIREPRRAKALAAKGRKFVLGRYRWKESGRKLESILKEAASGGRS